MKIKLLPYLLTCLSFTIIIGAAVYEHASVWPRAYAAPPRSLSMFQGAYGLNSTAFWKAIHPVTVLLFVTTLLMWWKAPARNYVLIPFAIYIIVIAVTFAYFVPELIKITDTQYADVVDDALKSRGSLWITLSLVRAVVLSTAAIILYLGLTKANHANIVYSAAR